MKTVYLFASIISLIFYQGTQYDEFLKLFSKWKYDENGNFLTRSLNDISISKMQSEYILIPDSMSLDYILNGDTSRLTYSFKFYNVDEDKYYEDIEPFQYYAVKSLTSTSFDMIIYSYYYLGNKYFYLKSFDRKGVPIDIQLINEVIYEDINSDYTYKHTLFIDDGFKVYSYSKNKDENKDIMKTKVIVNYFKVDVLGRFNLVSEDSIYLKSYISHYSKFSNEPEVDDPIYEYWTLW